VSEPTQPELLNAIVVATPELAAVVDEQLRPVFVNSGSAVRPYPEDPIASLHATDRGTVQSAVTQVLRGAGPTSLRARIERESKSPISSISTAPRRHWFTGCSRGIPTAFVHAASGAVFFVSSKVVPGRT